MSLHVISPADNVGPAEGAFFDEDSIAERTRRREALGVCPLAHELRLALALAERLRDVTQGIVKGYGPDHAGQVLVAAGIPVPEDADACWGASTFGDKHNDCAGLAWVLNQFVASMGNGIPPHPEGGDGNPWYHDHDDPEYIEWPEGEPAPAGRPFDFDIVRNGKLMRGFVSEAERDAAEILELLENAAGHVAGFREMLGRCHPDPASAPEWARHAAEDLEGLPRLLVTVAGYIETELSWTMVEQVKTRRIRTPLPRCLAVEKIAGKELLADVLAEIDRCRDALFAFAEKYRDVEPEWSIERAAGERWAARHVADLDMLRWAIGVACVCLKGELTDADQEAAFDRLEARYAEGGARG